MSQVEAEQYKDNQPLISVVMPVYNCERFVGEAIDSILNQTNKNFELIIVNDGSTDHSEKVILSFNDERIKYIRNQVNAGPSFATNRGFSLAKGKYVAGADSDDIYKPERLQKQVDYMENNHNVDILSSGYEAFGSENYVFRRTYNNNQIRSYFLWAMLIPNPCFVIRRSLLLKHNLRFDESIMAGQDYEFWERVSCFTKAHYYITNDILFKYRVHKNSISFKRNIIAQKTIGIVRERQLKRLLGNSYHPNHLQNLEMTYSGNINSFKEIASSLSFLKTIKTANRKKQMYDSDDFNKYIKSKYIMVCKRGVYISKIGSLKIHEVVFLPFVFGKYFMSLGV